MVLNNKSETPQTKFMIMDFVKIACGFFISQALYVTAKLGIADLLTTGAKSVDELAQITDTHSPSLYRLLRTLASNGIFTEIEPYRFALTPLAEYLQSDHPDSLRDLTLMLCDEWLWCSWGELFHSIKDGKSGLFHAYKIDDTYWAYLTKNPGFKKTFDKAMINIAKNFYEPVINVYDFSKINKIVDVGGGEGKLIVSILKANPHLFGILFDLPQTVAQAANLLEREKVANRCKTVGGDFLQSLPVDADLYIMSNVLIDWDDDKAVTILKNIRSSMSRESKLLVMDVIIPTGDVSHFSKWEDLFEVILGSGRSRTAADFSRIFQQANFQWVRTLEIGILSSAMELVPA
jgi:O-methyltransferase domain/Dimerisation domain